jgi:hypothetical protein
MGAWAGGWPDLPAGLFSGIPSEPVLAKRLAGAAWSMRLITGDASESAASRSPEK